jgi:hypothetical protein
MKNQIKQILREFVDEKNLIKESSLSKIYQHLNNHDCAIISAFRNEMRDCINGGGDGREVSKDENMIRNIELKQTLIALNYGVTKVDGTWLDDEGIRLNEKSLFVVNIKNKDNFITDLIRLGEMFCQDAVMIMEKGGDKIYLVGTNNSDNPGYGKKVELGSIEYNIDRPLMTKIKNQSFSIKESLETYDKLQYTSKLYVKKISKPIIERM